MERECVRALLLFSLFTLVLCNNVQALEPTDDDNKYEKKDEYEGNDGHTFILLEKPFSVDMHKSDAGGLDQDSSLFNVPLFVLDGDHALGETAHGEEFYDTQSSSLLPRQQQTDSSESTRLIHSDDDLDSGGNNDDELIASYASLSQDTVIDISDRDTKQPSSPLSSTPNNTRLHGDNLPPKVSSESTKFCPTSKRNDGTQTDISSQQPTVSFNGGGDYYSFNSSEVVLSGEEQQQISQPTAPSSSQQMSDFAEAPERDASSSSPSSTPKTTFLQSKRRTSRSISLNDDNGDDENLVLGGKKEDTCLTQPTSPIVPVKKKETDDVVTGEEQSSFSRMYRAGKNRFSDDEAQTCGAGLVVAVVANLALSCLSTTDRLKGNKNFSLLYKSVEDGRNAQGLSCAGKIVRGKSHNCFEGGSSFPDGSGAWSAGAKNFVGETANSWSLRFLWDRLSPRLKKTIKNCRIVQFIDKAPKKVKTIGLAIGRSVLIKGLLHVEGHYFFSHGGKKSNRNS